jgi:mRNA-degrading endonuclease RelE of RelBE toxin-antitoxin system
MNIIFETTEKFDKDLHKFNDVEQKMIAEHIDTYGQTLKNKKTGMGRGVFQPCEIKLINGYVSSLYALKVKQNIRVLMTIDVDTIFDQKIITLLRVVNNTNLLKAFNSTSKSLYQVERLLNVSS